MLAICIIIVELLLFLLSLTVVLYAFSVRNISRNISSPTNNRLLEGWWLAVWYRHSYNMSDAFSKKLDIFATPLCHVCCNWIATKLYFAGETQWVYTRFQTGLNKTLMKCATGSNWFTYQLRVNQRKDVWVCMEPTDCRAGKDFRNNLIQPPLLLIRKVTTREGKGLTQGHTAGSNFVCFKN